RTTAHLWRSLAVAVVSTYAALAGHLLGGGQLPGTLGLALPLALSVLGCLIFAGRTAPILRTAISVSISQGLFHALFMVGAGGSHASSDLGPAAHHAHVTSIAISSTGQGMNHAMEQGMVPMWLGHVFAAIATVVFLSRVDRALALILDLGRAVLWPLLMVLRIVVLPTPFGAGNQPRRQRTAILTAQAVSSVSSPRGPPTTSLSCN
ncbi:MAG: hypothetical protein L0H32_07415, partial [Micrococcaceae bacterium]|nr:hypothetical protein [Micrococcaceae bacterium]